VSAVDPLTKDIYEKLGCDTKEMWQTFLAEMPSPEYFQKYGCVFQKEQEKCEALNHCDYNTAISFCMDSNTDYQLRFESTDDSIDCSILDPETCGQVGCMVILPNSEQSFCQNM